jgi:hypothetical protein
VAVEDTTVVEIKVVVAVPWKKLNKWNYGYLFN